MSIEKIKRLEELVDLTSQALNNLQADKKTLKQRVQELEKEKKITLKTNESAKDALEKLKELKISHSKLQKDRSVVRLKVKNTLKKIEEMDFF